MNAKKECEVSNQNFSALTDEDLSAVSGGVTINNGIKVLDTALQKSLDTEANVGASRNRLDYTSSN